MLISLWRERLVEVGLCATINAVEAAREEAERGPMNEQEAEQVMRDVCCQFKSAVVELDLSFLRHDGNGYRVAIRWAGRSVVIGKSREWSSIRLAWQALNERR